MRMNLRCLVDMSPCSVIKLIDEFKSVSSMFYIFFQIDKKAIERIDANPLTWFMYLVFFFELYCF